jgi:imidazolonepropionase-like amidohydrolase
MQFTTVTIAAQKDEKSAKPDKVLIKNVSIFNGTSEKLITGKDVVLAGNTIDKLIPSGSGGEDYDQVIDGKDGYLTPGLIDVHWHTMLNLEYAVVFSSPKQYITAVATMESEQVLMRGFTTIRDAAGDVAGLKQAIDEGHLTGPRIYPSQAGMTQYSGHIDFRNPNFLPKEWGGPISPVERIGLGLLVTGKDQMTAAVRHQLSLGATQIKLAVTGGVSSFKDPLYVNEFRPEEIEAAVDAAADFGTYVMVHAHSSEGIKRAIKAGVKSVEHARVSDESVFKMMAKYDVMFSMQGLNVKQLVASYPDSDPRKTKAKAAWENTPNIAKWAKKHGVKIAFGTDLLDGLENRKGQLDDLALRKTWFTSPEVMIQATGNAGDMVALCGKRNPYGKLGVIETGAMADVLIYSKNPLDDVAIVADPENNLKLIMKDGKVYKNTLN